MSKFDPRAIPGRAHYDRLQTWAKGVLGNQHPDDLANIQAQVTQAAKDAIVGDDDFAKIQAVLAEIGFCFVIDSMADEIERSGDEQGD